MTGNNGGVTAPVASCTYTLRLRKNAQIIWSETNTAQPLNTLGVPSSFGYQQLDTTIDFSAKPVLFQSGDTLELQTDYTNDQSFLVEGQFFYNYFASISPGPGIQLNPYPGTLTYESGN
jgi:hypothetical protein